MIETEGKEVNDDAVYNVWKRIDESGCKLL